MRGAAAFAAARFSGEIREKLKAKALFVSRA